MNSSNKPIMDMDALVEIGISSLARLIDILLEFFVNYSFQVVGAIIILIIGLLIARWASKFVIRLCETKGIDVTLRKFLADVVKILIIIFVLIICLGKFGITVSPFIAALGAVALGVSLALQGLYSNYAAGLIIIVTRPFVVGNTIAVKGTFGVVEEVKLVATILSTEDGERITIPNKHILGEILYNSFAYRVVESSVLISYNSNPETAIEIVKNVLKRYSQIPSDPRPQFGIQKFADSGIEIGIRYWVPTKQYFQTQYDVNLSLYQALREGEITIPYPQHDVHIVSGANGKPSSSINVG